MVFESKAMNRSQRETSGGTPEAGDRELEKEEDRRADLRTIVRCQQKMMQRSGFFSPETLFSDMIADGGECSSI